MESSVIAKTATLVKPSDHVYVVQIEPSYRVTPRHALRPNRNFVAVILRDGREDLERLHVGVRRPANRHVDPAVSDRVRPQKPHRASQ